jgi:hypothetical protein
VFGGDGSGVSGSCPRSELGVTAGAGVGAGATGAMGLGRAIGLFIAGAAAFGAGAGLAGAALTGARLAGAALARAVLRATFFAFLATFALLAFFFGRVFFFATRFAAARLVLAAGRFFPLPFFFAMVSSLLAVIRAHVRVAPKKSAVICA